jgi:signal transduction histidine kinase
MAETRQLGNAARGAPSNVSPAFRSVIESKKLDLKVALPPEPLLALADATRLQQIVGNLLTNAAKYTDQGGHITLSATLDRGSAVNSVRDTGVGIPAEMIPRIFGLFTQAASSLNRSQGGLGIGLTLVRRLVEMHDGRISVVSEGSGMGSEFTIRLPALIDDAPTQS